MVVVELAIAVVLLAGAGLLGQSLYRLLHVPLGFDPNHLATVRVMAPGTVYKSGEQTVGLYREIVRRVSSLPGVESAGMTSMLPVQCDCEYRRIQIPGRPYHGEHNEVDERHISAEYLPTLNATLVRGRFFTDADDASRPGVAVINQALARKYFPGEDPIGQRIADDEGGRPSAWEIVGVVDDVREGPLDVGYLARGVFPHQPDAGPLFQPCGAHTARRGGAAACTGEHAPPDRPEPGRIRRSDHERARSTPRKRRCCTGFRRGWWADLRRWRWCWAWWDFTE